MVNEQRRILVVAHTLALANSLLSWLTEAGYDVAIVTTFSAARAHLKTSPGLLLTELKLREYNGLHLALRAREDGIPAAVIGESDLVLEEDARQLGASYVNLDGLVREDILLLVEHLLSGTEPLRHGTHDHAPAHYSAGSMSAIADVFVDWTGGFSTGGALRRPLLH